MTRYTVVSGGGYVDVIFGADQPVNSTWVDLVAKELRRRLGASASVGSHRSEFGFRLSGASALVAHELRKTDAFPASPVVIDPAAAPEIRFVHEGVAVVEPSQTLPASAFLRLARTLAASFEKRVGFGLLGEQLGYIAVSEYSGGFVSPLNDAQLMELVAPRYRHTGWVHAGVHEGRHYVRLDVPEAFDLEASGLGELDFVLTDPAPVYLPFGYEPGGDLAVYVNPAGTDAEQLWEAASRVALHLGVHPVGDFHVRQSDRLSWVYKPAPLSR